MTVTSQIASTTPATRFCRNCGSAIPTQAAACISCGLPPDAEAKFCPACGASTDPRQVVCVTCGVALRAGGAAAPGARGKVAAGLLAIFFGGLGVHKFYLGYAKEGAIMLAVALVGSVFTAGIAALLVSLVGFIEGIIYLTKSDADFARTYVQERRPWF